MSPSEASELAGVHLYVVSPSCKPFSRRNHKRSLEGMSDGFVDIAQQLAFVAGGHANVVVIENVDEPDAAFAIRSVLRASCQHYSWREQALGAVEHAGVPHERMRRFWVGVRERAP